MRRFLRGISIQSLYIISFILIGITLFGIWYIFREYKLGHPIFLFLLTLGYPLVAVFEVFVEWREYNENIKLQKQGYILQNSEEFELRPYVTGMSLIFIVVIMMFTGFFLFMRILIPESIDGNSAAYSLMLFVTSILLYLKRKKEIN